MRPGHRPSVTGAFSPFIVHCSSSTYACYIDPPDSSPLLQSCSSPCFPLLLVRSIYSHITSFLLRSLIHHFLSLLQLNTSVSPYLPLSTCFTPLYSCLAPSYSAPHHFTSCCTLIFFFFISFCSRTFLLNPLVGPFLGPLSNPFDNQAFLYLYSIQQPSSPQ